MREAHGAGMDRQGQSILLNDSKSTKHCIMQALVDPTQVVGRVQVREDELCRQQWKKRSRKGLGMDESENVRNAEGTTMTPKLSCWWCEYQRLGSKKKIKLEDENQMLILGFIILWCLWGMSSKLLHIGIWSLTWRNRFECYQHQYTGQALV